MIWAYYKKSDNELYAFTDEKKVRNAWIKYRDTDKFFIEKKVDLTYEKELDFRAEFLDNYIFLEDTYVPDMGFPITITELTNIKTSFNNFMYSGIYLRTWCDFRIFNEDIQEKLMKVGYVDLHTCISGEGTNGRNAISFLKGKMDFISLFVKFYGDTLRKDLQ